jgi:DHA3 family macrolide efflux protein-like MFS transporter
MTRPGDAREADDSAGLHAREPRLTGAKPPAEGGAASADRAVVEFSSAARRPARSASGGPGPTWQRALFWLWVGQVVSQFGDSLFKVGIFFLALEITGSKAQSGLLLALNFVPALGLGLFAGAFVDRHDRRRVMLAAELLRGAAVASIPILHAVGALTTWALGLAMFALALGSAFFNPALKAIIPELVPPHKLAATATWFQLSDYAALALGPALAGLVIIPEFGTIHLFTFDAATFAVGILCVLALAPVARKTAHTPAPQRLLRFPAGTAGHGLWRETIEGVKAVAVTPVVRGLLFFVAVDNLLLSGLTQVGTPLLVKETLGLGNDAFARVQSWFFLGMLVSSATLLTLARRLRKGISIVMGLILDGLTLIPLAFCRTLPEVGAALFVHALAVPLIIIPRTVLMQQRVPGPLHGRAFALINVTVFGMTAISSGITGVLAEVVPAQQLFLGLGIAGAGAGVIALLSRNLRTAT